MLWHYSILIAAKFLLVGSRELPECSKDQRMFTYTECDLNGGRWRVQVPQDPTVCQIAEPDAPKRGKDCGFSCDAGYYLDLKSQICMQCQPGTFSLGSGVRFDEWDKLPDGFTVNAETVTFSQYGYHSKVDNCSKSTWKPAREYIISNDDDCSSSLSYSVHLDRDGYVKFSYQSADTDVMFHFYVQNSQCQTYHDSRKNIFLNTTGPEWRLWKVPLPSGLNVLYWKTTGILLGNRRKVDPVKIRSIEITGVSYTTECHKCRPGFYASGNSSNWCEICPADTMSGVGASHCTPCDKDRQFAPQASANCLLRPPCEAKDYFATHSPCSVNKTTKVTYKWIEPKVCLESLSASVSLPPSGQEKSCAPCNPGHAPSKHKCIACSSNTFSDGASDCTSCPPNTSPQYGYWYLWWDTLPENMQTTCVSLQKGSCAVKQGWQPAGDEIRTTAARTNDAYLILVLTLSKGFLEQYAENEYGRIRFAFQLECSGDCQLYFMKDLKNEGTYVLQGWRSTQAKQTFTYTVSDKKPITFSWAFQKSFQNPADTARLFFVNVTNAAGGSADRCTPCRSFHGKSNQCVPCPNGAYVNSTTFECTECPPGTKVNPDKSGCQVCGRGTSATPDQSLCENDCTFKSQTGRQFDFHALSGAKAAVTLPSFTSSGRKYSHVYNFSLCGNHGEGRAECVDNVTSASTGELGGNAAKRVNAMVCRSTAVPVYGAQKQRLVVHSQPTELANVLSEVVHGFNGNSSSGNLTESPFPKDKESDEEDVIFRMSSTEVSEGCSTGRHVFVHMRCDPSQPADTTGKIEMPAQCPDGTCDGCNFQFLWRSIEACPLCSEVDYEEIAGPCNHGEVTTKYVWKRYPKKCHQGAVLPDTYKSPCKDYTFYIELGAIGGVLLIIAMCMATCCFWKKSKKLEYKYHRLMVNTRSGAMKGGLPAADSCAISDSEESDFDGQSDEVVFQKKKSRLLQKKNDYESVVLQPIATSGV